MFDWKPPWLSYNLPSITDDKFITGGRALAGASDVGSSACLDYEYPNAWFLLPPWPDDNEPRATAEPPDKR